MAKIDYNGIKSAVKSIIEAGSFTYSPVVGIESNLLIDAFDTYVNIELDSRSESQQGINSGLRTRYNVVLVLNVWVKNWDKSQSALIRDTLIGELELLLIQHRNLNNTVTTSWLTGGQCISAYIEDLSAFVSAGEIRLNLDCTLSV